MQDKNTKLEKRSSVELYCVTHQILLDSLNKISEHGKYCKTKPSLVLINSENRNLYQ